MSGKTALNHWRCGYPSATGSTETTATETIENRIVALTSLNADLVQTLDDDALVGIPGNELLRQDERFTELPTLSEGRTEPDLEQIVALEPTLVIGAAGFHDPPQVGTFPARPPRECALESSGSAPHGQRWPGFGRL